MKAGAIRMFIPVPVVAAILSSCAGPIETRISSSGSGAAAAGSYALADPGDVVSEESRAAYEMVAQMLDERGWNRSTGADATSTMLLTVALADRPADIALTRKQGTETVALSAAKTRRLLQSCADREYRLSVRIDSVTDGAPVYVASASEYHCRAGLGETLPALARAALADLAAPRGSYAVTRQGRE